MPYKDREKQLTYNRAYNKKLYQERGDEERARIKRRRDDLRVWARNQRIGKVCSTCGFNDPRALDFHHLGGKSFSIANAASGGYSKEKIAEEIAKCIVLCANCHRISHSRVA